jgi:hypothetical protein
LEVFVAGGDLQHRPDRYDSVSFYVTQTVSLRYGAVIAGLTDSEPSQTNSLRYVCFEVGTAHSYDVGRTSDYD